MISFFVEGEPRGKQRARILRNPKNPRKPAFTPKATMDAERAIGWACKRKMAGAKPLEGPVWLGLIAWFPYPKSWSAKRRDATVWHTSKPDRDNIEKLVTDALNGIAWKDDAQVCCGHTHKFYVRHKGREKKPGVIISFRSVGMEGPRDDGYTYSGDDYAWWHQQNNEKLIGKLE